MFRGDDQRHLKIHLQSAGRTVSQSQLVSQLSRRELGKIAATIGLGVFWGSLSRGRAESCVLPARNPIEGPYFLGDPEQRDETGRELSITGTVRDAVTCQPINGARIVRWHANQYGIYEEYYRALMIAGADGKYQLRSIAPGQYANLDPHVHFYVFAESYQPVIAQAQWPKGKPIPEAVTFDFSMVKI